MGVRELTAAAGLLGTGNPVWLWARVAGDLMDLGLLGWSLASHDREGWERRVAATAAVAGLTGVDLYAAVTRSQRKYEMDLTAAVTVGTSPEEAYNQWRQLESLPQFMAHLDEVRPVGNGTTHWRASAPFGRSVKWDAEITEDVTGERIAWRSVGQPDVANDGEVRFRPAPGSRGTEIHVMLRYWVPGSKLGEAVARYFGEDPHQQLDDDLRRFKRIAFKNGEVVRSRTARPGASAPAGSSRSIRPGPCPKTSCRRCGHESQLLDGTQHRGGPGGPRSGHPQPPGRDREDHLDGDLRVRPAPARRLRADDAKG